MTATITADNKVYDGTTNAVTHITLGSGVVSGDNVSVVDGTGTFANKNAGTRTVTDSGITLSGPDAGNYAVNGTATATAMITQATPAFSSLAPHWPPPRSSTTSSAASTSAVTSAATAIPSGSVSITVHGVTMKAAINASSARFAVTFNSSNWAVGSYPVTFPMPATPTSPVPATTCFATAWSSIRR